MLELDMENESATRLVTILATQLEAMCGTPRLANAYQAPSTQLESVTEAEVMSGMGTPKIVERERELRTIERKTIPIRANDGRMTMVEQLHITLKLVDVEEESMTQTPAVGGMDRTDECSMMKIQVDARAHALTMKKNMKIRTMMRELSSQQDESRFLPIARG